MKVRLPKNQPDPAATSERPSTPKAIIVNPVPPTVIMHSSDDEHCPCCGGKLVPYDETLDPFELISALTDVSADKYGHFNAELQAEMLSQFVDVATKETLFRRGMQVEFDEIKRTVDEAEAFLKESEDVMAGLEETICELKAEIAKLTHERSVLKAQIDRGDEKIWRLKHKISELYSNQTQAKNALEEATSNRAKQTAQSKLDRVTAELDKAKADIEEARRKLSKRQQDVANSETKEKLLKVRLDAATTELEEEKAEYNKLRSIVDELNLPHFYVGVIDGTVVMTSRNYETDADGGELYTMKELDMSSKWSNRIFDYAFRSFGVSLSVAEYYTIIKIVISVAKLKPGQFRIHYGKDTEVAKGIIEHFSSRNF